MYTGAFALAMLETRVVLGTGLGLAVLRLSRLLPVESTLELRPAASVPPILDGRLAFLVVAAAGLTESADSGSLVEKVSMWALLTNIPIFSPQEK